MRFKKCAELVNPPLLAQPEDEIRAPRVGTLEFGWFSIKTQAVTPFLENVQIKRNLRTLKRRCEQKRVFDGHRSIFRRMPDKTRRCLRSDLQLV